uniref:Macro domain-containing protein n=1 Tax=Gadus morhua TaxID=8049 RepID=A0A8C5ACR7_GADMO
MTKTNQLKMPLDGNGINILRQCGPAIKDVLKYKYECSIDVLGMDSVMGEDFAHAVVNVANENPPHYGGPALALCEAGGPDIQSDSDKYIKRNGALKTGDAVIGNPGYDVQWAEPQLKRTVKSILDRAEENNFKSVAIPALSSVVFNFPVDKCTDIIVDTVRKYIECGYQRGILCEIVLVNNDEPAVKEMERASARSKTNTNHFHNASLSLSFIVLPSQTDVIVNTTGDNLCLSNGEVSKAILKKAGSKMQEEIDKKYKIAKKSLPLVLKTNSYGLGCKDVYHTLVPVKGVDRAGEVTTSIAFPAIGTGHLGFTKQEVAQIMTKAVEDSAQKMQTKMEVDFVIHPPENDTFMVTYSSQNTSSAPEVRMSSASIEANEEARSWLEELLRCSGTATVNNNFIQYLGVEELHQLNSGAAPATWIEEFFEKGCAKIKVQAESPKDVIVHVLKAETLLCAVQKEFARGVKAHMPINFLLQIVNAALMEVFELKKKQLGSSSPPRRMYHRIPAQFCSRLQDIGFQREYAPPSDPKYGEGIYFSGSVRGAVDLWREQSHQDVYQYYVEAKVLTGKSTPGKRDLIMPPPVGDDPLVRFESLSGGTDICVIFNGHQALPECIIICKSYDAV